MARTTRLILCPYCGHTQPQTDRCVECAGLFEPLSRKATQITMGPWFIRDKRMPYRPGCSFDVLRRMIKVGKVQSNTVMRGPTTHQFWSVARHVPGVSHLLGYCHQCGTHVDPENNACPSCQATFPLVDGRDRMGLVYATKDQAGRAQRELNREIAEADATSPALTDIDNDSQAAATKQREREAFLPGPELLNEVLGTTPPVRPRHDEATLRPPTIPAAPSSTPVATASTDSNAATPANDDATTAVAQASPAMEAEPVNEVGALDFAPFDPDGYDGSAGGALNGGRTINFTAIALIALNVIVLLIVAYVVVRMASGTPDESGSNDEPPRMNTNVQPSATTPPRSATNTDRPSSTSSQKAPSESAATVTPAPATPEPSAAQEEDQMAAQRRAAVAAMARSREFENAGDYEAALAELTTIAQSTPLAARPREMEIAIRRLEGEINRRKMDVIFDGIDDE